jgi:pectate lyase
LRSCLASSNRRITFRVGGSIACGSPLRILSNTTIDGSTAPSPGISIYGCGLRMSDAHDIRIEHIRLRDPGSSDTVQIGAGAETSTHPATRVHLSHVSLDSCGDGNADITDGTTDVTIDYSILSNCTKNSLIKYDDPSRISLHHNVYAGSQYRNPFVSAVTNGMSTAATNVHFEGNVVWNWGNSGGGIGVECGAKVNVEHSMFRCLDGGGCDSSRRDNGIIYDKGCTTGGRIFSLGNLAPGASLRAGNSSTEFPRPVPDLSESQDACTAAKETLATAGARPLDSIDEATISGIHTGCN